jgi:hypothetical protein
MLELVRHVAQPRAQDEPPARQLVERRDLLGHLERMVRGEQHDVGAEVELGRARQQRSYHRQRRRRLGCLGAAERGLGRKAVLAEIGDVVAQLLHLGDERVEPRVGIARRAVDHRAVDQEAELHRTGLLRLPRRG